MRKACFWYLLLLIPILLGGNTSERGLTSDFLDIQDKRVTGQAKLYSGSPSKDKSQSQEVDFDRNEWEVIDSLNFDCYLGKSDNYAIEYNGMNNTINLMDNNLSDLSYQALEYAPQWMHSRLSTTLMSLDNETQEFWSNVILESNHPYVDEIAFVIAYSSKAYLESEFASAELINENAWLIYEHDLDLSYVEVLDYGTPETDENYYSTTKYWKSNINGDLYQVEVPRDIYYMYIVHPKITDEIPAYIDKEIIEHNSDHQNNIVGPDAGEFWRSFLYDYNDPGYPKLRYSLQNCDRVWNGIDISDNTAIGALTSWLSQSMQFTSNTERPHQPVRIYTKHIGRCGEHADMRGAIARLALIPCTSILTISGDHTWNEFWDEEWIHWDGNDINYPLLYENGWGRQYGTVFEIRSDGLITSVTDRYSEGTAWITLYVLDMDGNPVDGARIVQGVYYDDTIKSDFVGFTDNEGKYTFEVGEGRHYYAQMTSALGDIPGYLSTVELTENGMEYEYELTAPGYMPEIPITEIDIPEDSEDDFKLIIDYTVSQQLMYGNIVFNDLEDEVFYEPLSDGNVNFFMMDLINYYAAIQDAPFEAFNGAYDSSSGLCDFDIVPPEQGSWYAILNNDSHVGNPQYIKGYAALYAYDGAGGTGTITGVAWDSSNEQPLDGAVIKAGVYETTTDSDGNYSLEVFPNTYIVSCIDNGYCIGLNDNIIVNENGTTNCDFDIMEMAWAVSNLEVTITDETANLSWDEPSSSIDNDSQLRELLGYNIYIGSYGEESEFLEWDLIAENVADNQFIDQGWQYYEPDIYRYAVVAQYSLDNQSQPVFSEPVDCHMTVDVTIIVNTNSGDSVIGTLVTMTNQECTNSLYNYDAVINNGNIITFEDVRKGSYILNVSLSNFQDYESSEIVISDDIELNVELEEKLTDPMRLAVINYLLTWELDYVERDLQNFQVYYDGELLGVDIEMEYVLPNTPGLHTAGVKAIFTTGESEIVELQYENGYSSGSNLELYIPFENSVIDLSTNGYPSTIIGDISYDTGVNGECAVFDEVGEYVSMEGLFSESVETFSVSWWLNPESHFDWNQQVRAPQGWNGFNFHSTTDGTIYVGTDIATRFTPNSLQDKLYLNEWNYFFYTYNEGHARFFRNGNLIGERVGVTAPESWNGFQMGTDNQNTIDGALDEMYVWSRELGRAEIEMFYIECIDYWNSIDVTALDQSGDPIENMHVNIGMFSGITNGEGIVEITVPQNSTNNISYWVPGYDTEYVEGFYSDESGNMTLLLDYSFTGSEYEEIPEMKEGISGVYPNPFNPVTTISFNVKNENKNTKIAVYNLKGQEINVLIDDYIKAGCHEIEWEGFDQERKPVGSGLYFIRMQNGDSVSTAKVMLLK